MKYCNHALGLVGLVCGLRLEASHVIMTDLPGVVLENMQFNIQENMKSVAEERGASIDALPSVLLLLLLLLLLL